MLLDRRNKDDDFFQRNVIVVTSFPSLFSPPTLLHVEDREKVSNSVILRHGWILAGFYYETRKWIEVHFLCAFLFFFCSIFFLLSFLSFFLFFVQLLYLYLSNFLNCSSHSSFILPSCTRELTALDSFSLVFLKLVSECEVISRVYVVNLRDVTG